MTICLWLLIAVVPLSSWAAEKTGPGMVIPEPLFDAGRVDQGTSVMHDFIVKNMGDEVLEIISVTPD